jgi:hypothetical protein
MADDVSDDQRHPCPGQGDDIEPVAPAPDFAGK